MNDLQGNSQTVINLLNYSVHAVGKKKDERKKNRHSSCYTTAQHQLIHRRPRVKPPLLCFILSVCSHYFPTCHLLLTSLTNSSLIQFFLQRRFLKHSVETTSHNDISSHVAKHYNSAYPIFFLVVEWNTRFWVQSVVGRITSCSSS